MTGPAHIFDKPNRYIGKPEPRADAARLLQGRGRFVDDDQKLPRMVHAAFRALARMRMPRSSPSTPKTHAQHRQV